MNVLQRFDGAQRPADQHYVRERIEKFLKIGGTPLRRVTRCRRIGLTLAAWVEGKRTITLPQLLQLPAPNLAGHRPTGNKRNGGIAGFRATGTGFEQRESYPIAGLKVSSNN